MRNKNKKMKREKSSIKSHHKHQRVKKKKKKWRLLSNIKRMKMLLLSRLSHKHNNMSKLRDKNKTMKDRF